MDYNGEKENNGQITIQKVFLLQLGWQRKNEYSDYVLEFE